MTFWQEPANPYDLGPASFRGPVEKPRSEGGVGKKKPNRRRTSPLRVAEVRARKVAAQKCRVCWDSENLHATTLFAAARRGLASGQRTTSRRCARRVTATCTLAVTR